VGINGVLIIISIIGNLETSMDIGLTQVEAWPEEAWGSQNSESLSSSLRR